jgi:ADP-ribose pyrophosphatase YjhB (NUDIX family)
VPGGVYEPHETLAETVKRETFEETGIHCEIERFLGVFSHPGYNLLYPNGDRVQPWTAAFVCRATSNQIQVDGKESLQASFHPPVEVMSRFPLMYQHALQAILNQQAFYLEPIYYAEELTPYYPVLRRYVGSARVILPGCVGVVFNATGEVLAVYKHRKQVWQLPAGLADLGESSTGTICREILEETGLEVEPYALVGIYSQPEMMYVKAANGDEVQSVDLMVACRVVGGSLRPDGHEISEVSFRPIPDLLAQPGISTNQRQFLQDILAWDGQTPFIR